MLKKSIQYINEDGEAVKEDLYFNITKAELIRIEFETEGGMAAYASRVISSSNNKEILEIFDTIIRKSYGVRTRDGKFVKNAEATEVFLASEAFSALLMELISDGGAAAEFINGMMPKDLVTEVEKGRSVEDVISPNLSEHLGLNDFKPEPTEEEMLQALGVVEPAEKDYSKMSAAELRALPRKELIAAYKQKSLG